MTRATPKMRNYAGHLIAHEARDAARSKTSPQVIFPVVEKLRPHLATLMGKLGFRALLSRALALAGAEVPWLRTVPVKADDSFEGLGDLGTQVDARELFEGRVVLVAQILGLLVAFIGEDLTLRLLREVWPKLSLNGADSGKGDKK